MLPGGRPNSTETLPARALIGQLKARPGLPTRRTTTLRRIGRPVIQKSHVFIVPHFGLSLHICCGLSNFEVVQTRLRCDSSEQKMTHCLTFWRLKHDSWVYININDVTHLANHLKTADMESIAIQQHNYLVSSSQWQQNKLLKLRSQHQPYVPVWG